MRIFEIISSTETYLFSFFGIAFMAVPTLVPQKPVNLSRRRSKFARILIDIFAVIFGIFFVCAFSVGIAGVLFVLITGLVQ